MHHQPASGSGRGAASTQTRHVQRGKHPGGGSSHSADRHGAGHRHIHRVLNATRSIAHCRDQTRARGKETAGLPVPACCLTGSPCGTLGMQCLSTDTSWGTDVWPSPQGGQRGTAHRRQQQQNPQKQPPCTRACWTWTAIVETHENITCVQSCGRERGQRFTCSKQRVEQGGRVSYCCCCSATWAVWMLIGGC